MKTRAYDPIEKRWRTDYVVMPDGNIWQTEYIPGVGLQIRGIVHWKLSRFTGHLDKNGKEIWEHDICKIKGFHVTMQDNYPIGPVPIETSFDYVAIVKMDNPYSPIFDIGEGGPDIEVLGNAFENPELLEV